MSIKLIAIDIDDTLVTDELVIPAACKVAIQEAQEAGVRVVLATGRMFQATIGFARELNLNGPLICYNGALVQPVQGPPLFHHTVPLDLAWEIIAFGKRENLHVNVYLDDELYVEKVNEYTRFYTSISRVEARAIGDLLTFVNRPPTKVLYVSEPEVVEKWRPLLAERYRGQLEVFRSKPQYLEFTGAGVSKGAALRELAEYYHLDCTEVMAIGDSFNDIPMLEYAGVGVAVANAPAEVRRHADWVTLSNEEAGVAEAIRQFVL